MKFNVGNIVKRQNGETSIILATKKFALTSKNLQKLNGEVLIKGIDELAKTEIHVPQGLDYVICKISSYEGKYCILDDKLKFRAVFEDDLT